MVLSYSTVLSHLTLLTNVMFHTLEWFYLLVGQLETWIDAIEEDLRGLGLRLVYGHRDRKQTWLAIYTDLASNRNARSAMIRDVHRADLINSTRTG